MKYSMKIIFLFLVLVGLNACGNEQHQSRQLVDEKKSTEILNQRNYLAELGLILPKNSTIVYFYQQKGGDLYIRLKIKIDSQDFNNWMSSFFNGKEEYFTEDNRYLLEPDSMHFKQWQPSKERALFALQVPFDQGRALNLGITSKGKVEEDKLVYMLFVGT